MVSSVHVSPLILTCVVATIDESKKTIRDLRSSSHQVKMITGDNALTACDVARKVRQHGTRGPKKGFPDYSALDRRLA